MIVHLPTPHDHFSPTTGSAVMTVIDGLARGHASHPRHTVLVSQGTNPDHYDSAQVLEYDTGPYLGRIGQRIDSVAARLGCGRPLRERQYRRAVAALPPQAGVLLAHNAPYVARVRPAVPTVLYAHNEVLGASGWPAGRAVAGCAGVIAVSEWLADRLATQLPRHARSKVATIVNGVDADRYDAEPRPERGAIRVLFVDRIIPPKGPDLLVDALARLQLPQVTTRIVGSVGFDPGDPLTGYERSLRDRASRITGPVEFVPAVGREAIPSFFDWADIVVVPARWDEPCGLTLLEGLASGAAVIASRSGGMPEVAGDAALLVDRDDVDQLAAAIEGLTRDRAARDALGQAGHRRALEFSWKSRSAQLSDTLAAWGIGVQ